MKTILIITIDENKNFYSSKNDLLLLYYSMKFKDKLQTNKAENLKTACLNPKFTSLIERQNVL